MRNLIGLIAFLTLASLGSVTAQTSDAPAGASDRSLLTQQRIEIRRVPASAETQEPEPAPPTEAEARQLAAMAVAIDSLSLPDLDTALANLACEPECGTLLDRYLLLHRASRDSSPEIVRRLLEAGASVNLGSPPLAWTPLLTALYAARPDNARVLLEAGADPALVGIDGANAPFMADLLGLGDLIPFPTFELPQEEADLALLLAIEANNLEALKFALDAGANPRATSPENGWSALMIAAFNGYEEISIALLDHVSAAESRRAMRDMLNYQEPSTGLSALHAVLIGASGAANDAGARCTLALLVHRGIDTRAETAEGVDAGSILVNQGLDREFSDLLWGRNPRALRECRRDPESSEVTDNLTSIELLEESTQEQAVVEARMLPEELVHTLQSELERHNCDPGLIDGSFGPRSARALEMYNRFAPSSCEQLVPLEMIGREDPTDLWRAAASENLKALSQCDAVPACGVSPGPGFYRERTNGCWFAWSGPQPPQSASWEGSCDEEGFVGGDGTLTFEWSPSAAADVPQSRTGPFEKGDVGTGLVTTIGANGTVSRVTFAGGIADGPAEIEDASTGTKWSGMYRNGKQHGTWLQVGPGESTFTVEMNNGSVISGHLKYHSQHVYVGELNDQYLPDGFGTETIYFPNGSPSIVSIGRWQNGRPIGAREVMSYDANGTISQRRCRILQDGAWQEAARHQDGRCVQ